MKRFPILIIALVIVAMLIFTGCSTAPASVPSTTAPAPSTAAPAPSTTAPAPSTTAPAPSTTATGTPLKIGAILELTGKSTQWGQMAKAGIELALDEVQYKVAGHQVQLFEEDGAGDPTTETNAAKKLVEQDNVNIVLGPLNGMFVTAMAPYLAQNQVPEICYSQMSSNLKKFNWVFSPYGMDTGLGYFIGEYAAEKLGYKKVAIIGADMVNGYDIIGAFSQGFKEKGGTVVGSPLWAPLGTMDYSAYFGTLAAENADAVAAWTVLGAPFVKQYYQFGLSKKLPLLWVYANELTEPQLGDYGDTVTGLISSLQYNVRLDTPANQAFVADFQKKYNRAPTEWDVQGYEAAKIALAAFQSTGGDTNPDKLRNAIPNIKMNLPSGPLSFTSYNYGIRKMYIVQDKMVTDNTPGWTVIDTYNNDPDAIPQGPFSK